MKKVLIFALTIFTILSLISSCGNKQPETDKKPYTSEKTTMTTAVQTTASGSEIVEKIQSFSLKKLGLTGKKEDYKFLISTELTEIDGEKYNEVVASVMKENKDNDKITMDTKGTYYVSLDCKKCLIKDTKTGKISELK